MDLIALAAAKKYVNKVTAGFKSVELDGMNLIFTLLDDTKATIAIPAPADGKDGVSVQNLSIDSDGSLLCHMSDGSVIDAGYVPTVDSDLTNYYTKEEVDLKVPYEIIDTDTTISISNKTIPVSASVAQQLADYVATWTNIEMDINRPVKICFGRYNQGAWQLVESTFYGHGTGSSSSSGNTRAKKYLLYAIEPESWFNTSSVSGRICTVYVELWISGDSETGYTLQTGSNYLKAGYEFLNYALAENVLSKNNTSSYTPTGDYNPATKKYVDDAITEAIDSALKGAY